MAWKIAAVVREAEGEAVKLSGRKLYIHAMSLPHARLACAAMRGCGVEAEVTPPSDARTLELGSKWTSGDECFPARVTVGDYMRVLEREDPDKIAFLMPTADGPCRFGQYSTYLKKLLAQRGFPQVPVISPTSRDGYEGLGREAMMRLWQSIVAADILLKLLLEYRPYEIGAGRVEARYQAALSSAALVLEHALKCLPDCLNAFDYVLQFMPRRTGDLPLIGIVGEIFCRLNDFSNSGLIRRLEELGAECWISDVGEWVHYANSEVSRRLRLQQSGCWQWRRLCLKEQFRHWVAASWQRREERRLLSAVRLRPEPSIEEILEAAQPYLPADGAMGEMVVNVGRAVCLAKRGVDGIIDISPWGCTNGIVAEAVYPRISRDCGGIPIRSLYFDGLQDTLDTDLPVFMELVKSYRRKRMGGHRA